MRGVLRVVAHELDFYLGSFIDDMIVSQDITIPIDDHTRALGCTGSLFRLAELQPAAALPAKEALEELLHAIVILFVVGLLLLWLPAPELGVLPVLGSSFLLGNVFRSDV